MAHPSGRQDSDVRIPSYGPRGCGPSRTRKSTGMNGLRGTAASPSGNARAARERSWIFHGSRSLGLFILMTPGLLWGAPTPPSPVLHAWQVDAMQKVFKDAVPPAQPAPPAPIDAARNEVVSAQVVVWCDAPMRGVVCHPTPLVMDNKSPAIPAPRVRYVGYVPVNGQKPANTLRPRPCDYPDPIYDTLTHAVPPRTAQPVWLTLKIPTDAAPGLYTGEVAIEATVNGTSSATTVPIQVTVYAAQLPDKKTLYVTNWAWFDSPEVTRWCGVEENFSEPFWRLMEEVAKDMAFHRQNVILTPTTAWTWKKDDPAAAKDLITATVAANGKLEFDFTLFDRWVTTFRNAGVDGLIEGGPLAKHPPHNDEYRSIVWRLENGKAVKQSVSSVSPECEQYLSVFLPALKAHLEQKQWLGVYVQHILDEPNGKREPTYVTVAAWVRKYAPGIRTIDATQTMDLVGSIDIWVPTLRRFIHSQDFFRERQARGDSVWFYTMSRPVEFPLTRVRLMHWASFQSGVSGYLHWGYNWWVRSSDPNGGRWTLSPGDEWIVYPKPGGIVDSLRFEAMLEGLQDYELLKLLAARDPRRADALCKQLVDLDAADPKRDSGDLACKVDDSIGGLRHTRRELLITLGNLPK